MIITRKKNSEIGLFCQISDYLSGLGCPSKSEWHNRDGLISVRFPNCLGVFGFFENFKKYQVAQLDVFYKKSMQPSHLFWLSTKFQVFTRIWTSKSRSTSWKLEILYLLKTGCKCSIGFYHTKWNNVVFFENIKKPKTPNQ